MDTIPFWLGIRKVVITTEIFNTVPGLNSRRVACARPFRRLTRHEGIVGDVVCPLTRIVPKMGVHVRYADPPSP